MRWVPLVLDVVRVSFVLPTAVGLGRLPQCFRCHARPRPDTWCGPRARTAVNPVDLVFYRRQERGSGILPAGNRGVVGVGYY